MYEFLSPDNINSNSTVFNHFNFQAEQQDIVVRKTDENGNFMTTDNGTKYVLESIENTTGTVLPTIGIILVF